MSARSRPSPLACAAIAAGALLSLATTPPDRGSSQEIGIGSVYLDEDRLAYVAGHVEASPALQEASDGWVDLTFTLDGQSARLHSGEVQLWRTFEPFDGTLPASAELISSAVLPGYAESGEAREVYLTLGTELNAREEADFAYILTVYGDASFSGLLDLSAYVYAGDDPPADDELTVEIDAFEVHP